MRTNRGCNDLVGIDDELLGGVVGGVQYPGDNPQGFPRARPEDAADRARRVDRPDHHRHIGAARASARLQRDYGE